MKPAVVRVEGQAEFAVEGGDCVLRGALRAGIGFPYECNVGGCGGCRFELVDGEVETAWDEAPGLSPRDRKRGKRLACQSRPVGDCTIRVRLAEDYVPRVTPRRRRARLDATRDLTVDMRELSFVAEGPADFLAGQYALLGLPEVRGPRAYSMSNLANPDGRWQFIVRRVPSGAGSTTLFDRLRVGDDVELDGPYGLAFFRPGAPRDIVCVAGGSGLAPMLSIARAAAAAEPPRRLHFFFGGRTPSDMCAERELSALCGAEGSVRHYPVVSAASAEDGWSGARGFVHGALEGTLAPPLSRYEFYFAGPPPMITAMQELLVIQHRVPVGQVHFDRFV